MEADARCPRCATAVAVGQRFCGACGLRIEAAESAFSDAAEHRQMTIVFVDIVGSTALTETLGAEAFRELLRQYRALAAGAFEKYGGLVARYFGDGLLVYHGYPRAREDDARRAVQASLELQAAVAAQSPGWPVTGGRPVRLRIAAHTGDVIAGDMTAGWQTEQNSVVGNAANIAARLQEAAAPGTVIISEATHALVQRSFACTALGARPLKGIPQPVPIFRVDGPARSVMPFAERRDRAALVGREGELRALLAAWQRAQSGQAELVLLEAEAGMGKTRLIAELLAGVDPRACRQALLQCSPLFGNTALYPVREYVRAAFGLEETGSAEAWLDRLEAGFASQNLDGAEYAARLAPVLGIAVPPARQIAGASPQQDRDVLLLRLVEWLLHEAEQRPVLLVVEDVHWADPSTLELLTRAAVASAGRPILLLLSSRESPAAPWPAGLTCSTLRLGRLPPGPARQLIGLLARDTALGEPELAALQARADGVPLFLEELTSAAIEAVAAADGAADAAPGPASLPASLRDSLTARIDRAAMNRDILHLCATLGREFDINVLAATWPGDRALLQPELDRLLQADLLLARPWTGTVRYTFRHALIQEAIYGMQLAAQRRQNHARVAETLARAFPAVAENNPEIIAGHHLEAGNAAAALPLLQRAGGIALRRSAMPEAASQFRRALEILRQQPEDTARLRLELSLLASLGVALSAYQGFASAEAGAAFAQAREVGDRLGWSAGLFPALHGLYRFYVVSGMVDVAADLSCDMLATAHRERDPALLLEAHRAAGFCRFMEGRFTKAEWHFVRAAALYDPVAHAGHRVLYGTDPHIVSASTVALCALMRGRPEQALAQMTAALAAAETIAHPHSLCWVLGLQSVLFQVQGQLEALQRVSTRQLALAEEHGFRLWQLSAAIQLEWLGVVRAGDDGAIGRLQATITAWQGSGAVAFAPYFLSLLATAHRHVGDGAAADRVLAQAVAMAEAHGERWWLPQLRDLQATSGRPPAQHAGASLTPRNVASAVP